MDKHPAMSAAAPKPGRTVEAELFAVALDGEVRPAAEIDEIIWHAPGDLASVAVAPLIRDHVLPLVPTLRRSA